MKYLFFGLLLGGCGLDSMNASDTGSATFGELSISPSVMDFGYVAPGESATDTFVIANMGSNPVALRGLGVVGSNVFNVTTASQVPPALEKGDEVVLSVEFSPTGYEDYQAALAIQTDMPGLEYIERPILGTGLLQSGDSGEGASAPLLATDPSVLDFGQADLDATVTETLLLQNISTTDVMVKRIDFTDSQFDWEGNLTLPYLLKAGTSKELELNFTPSSESTYSGEAIILSDDPGQPELTVSLRGEGVDMCSVCAGIIQVNTGEDPYELSSFLSIFGTEDKRTVSITNIGDKTLTISNINVMNDVLFQDGTFKVTGFNPPMKLEPFEMGTFNVVYRATGTGVEIALPEVDSNVIHILSDDPWESDYVLKLSGVGVYN